MATNTTERYRISIKKGNKRYKALAHQVIEDETLCVELRSKPRPKHVVGGTLVELPQGVSIVPDTVTRDTSAHHIHYHPSGRVRVKASDGTILRTVSFPPLMFLQHPIPLFLVSVASLEQLDEDNVVLRFGDHLVDLDNLPVKRLQCEAWIGPKGSFKDVAPRYLPSQKVVYEDAALYDVAYFIGEGAPIDQDAAYDGIKLIDTRITGAPSKDIPCVTPIPDRSPEFWASPCAIARQMRAILEHRFQLLKDKLAQNDKGAWELRMSLCSDGIIAAIDWNQNISLPGYSFIEFFELSSSDVLRVLGFSDDLQVLKDVYTLEPALSGDLEGVVYIRTQRQITGALHNALIFRATEHLKHRYWRVPRVVLKNFDKLIPFIDSGG